MLRVNDVKWTDKMHARLKVLCGQKGSFTAIGAAMSHEFGVPISRNSCIGKAHRLGYKKKHRSTNEFTQRRKARKAPTVATPVPLPQPVPDLAAEATGRLTRPRVFPGWAVNFGAPPATSGPKRYLLQQLDGNMCHWPYGDRPPYLFCGAPTAGRSYCAYHTGISCGQRMVRDRELA